jgi:hypothetical protein
MTNLKDKLSASVRMAKAGQQPAAQPDSTPATASKPAPVKTVAAKPAATKQVKTGSVTAKPAPAKQPAAKGKPANVNQDSGNALFPSRVWPD